MIIKKHLIFLGGEVGVGKSIVASEIQKKINNSIVIDKDESTSVLVDALLESYGQPQSDRESEIYLTKIKPLEYKQLDNIVWNGFSNNSMIVTAPYFDSFLNKEWIETMKTLGDFHKAKVCFIFITRCSKKIRTNLILRNEPRDKYKINNYTSYRKATNEIISDILKNDKIKHINFKENIDINLIIKYLEN